MKQFNDVLDDIEVNLRIDYSDASIAKHALMNASQFRRMFSLLAGMSLAQYIRARVLSEATLDLRQGMHVLDVALKYGYDSQDGFSRAYRAYHGCLPSKNTSTRYQSPLRFKLVLEGDEIMDVRIIKKDKFKLMGKTKEITLQHEGENQQIHELLATLGIEGIQNLKRHNDGQIGALINASFDVANDFQEGSTLTQMICVSTNECIADYECRDVEAGSWAIFKCNAETLQKTWQRVYTEWFVSREYNLRDAPTLVAYQDQSMSHIELWIPIQ